MIISDSINTRENEFIDSLNFFDEWQDKYQFIVEYENKEQLLEKALRKEAYLVKGCQSKVWLYCKVIEGKLHYYSYSDAPIPKGLAAILCYIYSGSSTKEILSFDPQFLLKTALINYLSPLRQRGIKAMENRFKELAKTV